MSKLAPHCRKWTTRQRHKQRRSQLVSSRAATTFPSSHPFFLSFALSSAIYLARSFVLWLVNAHTCRASQHERMNGWCMSPPQMRSSGMDDVLHSGAVAGPAVGYPLVHTHTNDPDTTTRRQYLPSHKSGWQSEDSTISQYRAPGYIHAQAHTH